MSSPRKFIDATPSAALLIESIRDIGYTVETAIADLIDNSISASAKNIEIYLIDDSNGNPILSIQDDGIGMSEEELKLAMRLGSKDPNIKRPKDDLGRFGLGLKTASFSQCRELTVETYKEGKMTSLTWDLDEVKKQNAWVVIENEPGELKQGTKIIWNKIDRNNIRINSVQTSDLLNDIREHIGLVFHRFIEGTDSVDQKINIFINGNIVDSFNPFNENNFSTIKSEKRVYPYKGSKISIRSFVLPSRYKISQEEWRMFEGEGGYLRNQGFYVYRSNRLIIKGTWFGLLKKSEFTKLCRVRIDIENDLDTEWKIDIKKSKAAPPKAIRDFLGEFLDGVEIQGKKVYFRVPNKVREKHIPLWQKVSKNSRSFYEINRSHPLINKFLKESKDNFDYLKLIENTVPYHDIFNLISTGKESVVTWQGSSEDNLDSIKKYINLLKESKLDKNFIYSQIEEFIKLSELNISNQELRDLI